MEMLGKGNKKRTYYKPINNKIISNTWVLGLNVMRIPFSMQGFEKNVHALFLLHASTVRILKRKC